MARNSGWSSVQLASTVFSEVRDVQIDLGGKELAGKADVDLFITSLKAIGAAPRINVLTEDVANMQIAIGTKGTFTATHKNTDGATSTAGDAAFSITNAQVINHSYGGPHEQYGQLNTTLMAKSTDGATSPMTITIS